LEKINWPKNNEVYIGEIEIFKRKFSALNPDEYDEDSQVSFTRLQNFIKKEKGTENPIIRGPIEIARGENLILGIAPDQLNSFALIYNMNVSTDATHFALIESKGKEVGDVEIKFPDILPKHINNLVISESLAKKLKVKKDQDIKVLRIYNKTADINLDEV
jgi:hypothetical protein